MSGVHSAAPAMSVHSARSAAPRSRRPWSRRDPAPIAPARLVEPRANCSHLDNDCLRAILAFVQANSTRTQVSPAQLASELLDLWLHLARGTQHTVFSLVEELGLSITQMKTLHTLDVCTDELSVKELSEQLHLSLPAASRVADGLLKRGYVERREDEHDRRMKRIRITPEGRDVVERMQRGRLVGLEQFAASLSDDQRRALHAALVALPHRTTEGPSR